MVPGKARLTLSLPDWQKGRVVPAAFEVPVTAAKPAVISRSFFTLPIREPSSS